MRALLARWRTPLRVAPLRGPAAVTTLADPAAAVFFGYHDRTPFDADGWRVLAHRVSASDRDPQAEGTVAELGWFDLGASTPVFAPITTTTAWSWQQGSLLQWDPADPSRRVIFNRLDESRAHAVVVDADTGDVLETWPRPSYAVTEDGQRALSLNFARLARLRPGYGHRHEADSTAAVAAPEDDGVWVMDRTSGQCRLLVSLAEMAKGTRAPAGAHHYVNHLAWSPLGTRCVWFHIVQPSSGRRTIRGMVHDLTTGTTHAFEDERLISHQCWLDDERLLVTTRDAALVWRYTVYDLVLQTRVDVPVRVSYDGHPMRHPVQPHVVVTDTTPDPRRRQHLLQLDVATGALSEVTAWEAPAVFTGEVRCDLHPRWDRQGTRVCVDTAETGRRQMRVVTM